MSTTIAKRFAVPFLAVAALAGGSFLATSTLLHPARAADTVKVPQEIVAPVNDLSAAFRAVHNAVKDAVVNINVVKSAEVARDSAPMQIPDELKRFFGPNGIPEMPSNPRGGKIYGSGSGTLVTADGFILTNNHVVDDADKITVRLDDGREFKAKVIGKDPKSDIAVIKIEPAANEKFAFAHLGDSDTLDTGDWVLAFGSPFGFEQTMTQGIISAKGRSNINIIGSNNPALTGLTYENYLQTDAAINPGNSGGPLVNLKGQVIGVNSAIASRTGSYNGIGFAIPSNDAKYIMDSLMKGGKITRGYMGVGITDVQNPEVRERAKKDGFTGKNGVVVESVQAASPGGKGGLEAGDIITGINGKNAETMAFLRNVVARTKPGDNITLNIWRDGKTLDLTFPVGEQPDTAIVSAGMSTPEKPAVVEAPALGISVESVPEKLATKLNLKGKTGVVVSELNPAGLAADTALQVGDVILSVNRKPVTSTEEFATLAKAANPADGIRLSVLSPSGTQRLIYIEKQ